LVWGWGAARGAWGAWGWGTWAWRITRGAWGITRGAWAWGTAWGAAWARAWDRAWAWGTALPTPRSVVVSGMSPIVHRFARHAWRGVVLVIGLTLVVAGVVMLVTPGPGIAAILAGLALLSTEFVWAKRLLAYVRRRFDAARDQVRRRATRSR
jgi:hypothetical protein